MESISFNLIRESIFKMRLFSLVTLFVLCCVYLVESGRRYMIDGNKYYVSTPDEYYFYQSLEYCATNGMFLVDVRSEFEQENINKVLQQVVKELKLDKLSCWTSGTNTDQESNKFIWLTSGQEIFYSYWAPKNPSSGGDLFILVNSDARWTTSKGNVNASLICRDKLDDTINPLGSKPNGMYVHKRKTASKIKMRKKHKHG